MVPLLTQVNDLLSEGFQVGLQDEVVDVNGAV